MTRVLAIEIEIGREIETAPRRPTALGAGADPAGASASAPLGPRASSATVSVEPGVTLLDAKPTSNPNPNPNPNPNTQR